MADKVISQKNSDKKVKKPFNKKKWREEKYSNKAKVQRYQEKRKIILKRKLNKQLAKEGVVVPKSNNSLQNTETCSRIKAAQLEYERKKEEDRIQADEVRKVKEEKLKKIKEYQAKKAEKFRKLSQKTKKGQPIMRGRLELLQEKIQKMVAENRL